MNSRFSGKQRVRLVVREGPVGLEVAADDVELGELLEHRRQHHARHPVRRVDRRRGAGGSPPGRRTTSTFVHESRPDVLRRGPRRAARPGRSRRSARAFTSSSPESPPTGSAPRRTIFMPVYSFGVVRRGDADAAVEPELADRVVDHLGPDEPDVEDVGAAVGGTLDRPRPPSSARTRACRGRRRSRGARSARRTPRPIAVRAVLVELRRVEAADVVRLEDRGIEHARMLVHARIARADPLRTGSAAPPSAFLHFSHGAEARNRAVRRHRRLDGSRHGLRPGGRASAREPVLRDGLALRHDPRRHRREVRRRRGAGRVRRAAGSRGRRASALPARRSRCANRSASSASRRGSASRPARSSSRTPSRRSPPAKPSTSRRASSRRRGRARSSSGRPRTASRRARSWSRTQARSSSRA